MTEKETKLTMEEFHKKVAVETNNQIWPVLDAKNPTQAQLEEALHMAYASRYHWSKIGTPVNAMRAEYMIARVYCAMKRGEPALFHAKRCLDLKRVTLRTGTSPSPMKSWQEPTPLQETRQSAKSTTNLHKTPSMRSRTLKTRKSVKAS